MGNRAARVLNSGFVGNFNGHGAEEPRTLRFGVFELDLRAGELRRNGTKVKLQEQPFQVLAQLLETPGEVVTREQLRDRLWAADTFVDFDHSLNAAIRRLRDALGDSAENPTFVETVARRGYRFLAPVTVNPSNGNGVLPRASDSIAKQSDHRSRLWYLAVAAASLALILIGVGLGLFLSHKHVAATPPRISQLTANPADDRVRAAAISRDGKYFAFSDETGLYLRQVDTGETHPVALPEGRVQSIAWFPDNVHLVVSLAAAGGNPALWVVSSLGGNPRKLADDGWGAIVSPDGTQVAFITKPNVLQQIWLVDADGSQPHPLPGGEAEFIGQLAWSPDGASLAYTKYGSKKDDKGFIETRAIAGSAPTGTARLLNTWTINGLHEPLAWTSDGHLIYSLLDPPPRPPDTSSLWSVPVDNHGRETGAPVQLTGENALIYNLTVSGDGRRILYVKEILQPDVYVATTSGDSITGAPERLTLDDHQDFPFDWTMDGKEVLFTSDRIGAFGIFKQAIDKTVPDLLLRSPYPTNEVRMTPDGTQFLYLLYPEWEDKRPPSPLMRLPLSGGAPQKVLEATWIANYQCARAPATTCVYSVIDDTALTFFTFDPYKGKGKQVYQITGDLPHAYNWSLSPDGTTLAIARTKNDDQPPIHLVSLVGAPEKWLTVHGVSMVGAIDWAADGKSFWAPTAREGGNVLLNIDLQGHARTIWQSKNKTVFWAIPSRDGSHLALCVDSSSSNVWMLER